LNDLNHKEEEEENWLLWFSFIVFRIEFCSCNLYLLIFNKILMSCWKNL
jgi:hypothetical protein